MYLGSLNTGLGVILLLQVYTDSSQNAFEIVMIYAQEKIPSFHLLEETVYAAGK